MSSFYEISKRNERCELGNNDFNRLELKQLWTKCELTINVNKKLSNCASDLQNSAKIKKEFCLHELKTSVRRSSFGWEF